MRSSRRHPFGVFDGYVPLGDGEARLYRAVREAVPVVDAAIMKMIRLVGGFTVECGDGRAREELSEFLRTVNVGRGQRGINSFLDSYLDSMITCGRAVGEIVLGNRDIAAIICGNVADVQVKEGHTPGFRLAGGRTESLCLPRQELLLFTPTTRRRAPLQVSMLRVCPFDGHPAEDIQLHRPQLGQGGERALCRGIQAQGDILDQAYAREGGRSPGVERRHAKREKRRGPGFRGGRRRGHQGYRGRQPGAGQRGSGTADTGAAHSQDRHSLHAGANLVTPQKDVRPAGGSYDRELTAVRRTLDSVLEKICDLWLRMHGYDCGFRIVWDP